MLTQKDFCDHETSAMLKEIGYDYPLELITDYFGVLDTPIHTSKIHLYDAQKWLRQEKNIEINATFDKADDGWITYIQRLDHPDFVVPKYLILYIILTNLLFPEALKRLLKF